MTANLEALQQSASVDVNEASKGHPRGTRNLRLASRSRIDPFIVMDVMAEANARQSAGEDIIHMEVGQPGTPAPRAARERAAAALAEDRLGYTEALGLPELRERIALHIRERYGSSVSPERVVVTAGSSAAASCSPFSPCSTQATRSGCRRPAIPATGKF